MTNGQYHNGNFYYPSEGTGGNRDFEGYDTIKSPKKGRRFLSISSINDDVVPYEGGPNHDIGTSWIDSQESIFAIAKSQGYRGKKLKDSEGVRYRSSNTFLYSYLDGQVVHVKGTASHGMDGSLEEIIKFYLENPAIEIEKINSFSTTEQEVSFNGISSNNQSMGFCSWLYEDLLPDILKHEKGRDVFVYVASNGSDWCELGVGPSKEIAKKDCDRNASNAGLSDKCLLFASIDASGSYEIAEWDLSSVQTYSISELQKTLSEMGYDLGSVDGKWGKRSKAAIINFYSDRGQLYDGKLSQNEFEDLGILKAVDNYSTESVADYKIKVFAASDVSQKAIDKTTKWLGLAERTWFTKNKTTPELAYPILLVLVGENMDAAIELEQRLCAEIKETFADHYLKAYDSCKPWPECEFGTCYITEYALNGGASIASSRILQGFQLMIMSAKYPGPEDDDYDIITLHEAFHIFQNFQINERDHNLFVTKEGGRTGDHDRDTPWWPEGSAQYMALLLYSKQPGVRANFLKDTMRGHLEHYESGSKPTVEEYLNSDIKLYNIEYGTKEWRGPGKKMAEWFVAFLVDEFGEGEMYKFYGDLNELGFEDSFIKHFKKPYREKIKDFDVFIEKLVREVIKIIP